MYDTVKDAFLRVSSGPHRNIAAVIGAGYVLKVFLRELWTLGGGFYTYFLAQRINLKEYGEWAGESL